MWLGGARWTALALLAVSVAAMWQALKLTSWGFDGPGPGFFPQLVAGVCVALSLAVLLFVGGDPAPAGGEEGVERYETAAPAERRTFHIYLLALVLLVLGTWWVGFVVTAVTVVFVIMFFGEGRGWLASAAYGLASAAFGIICFGWLLRVGLPEGPVEHFIYSLLR